MAIPVPSIPSSTTTVSAVELKPTQNNKGFYINSGLISANNTETTVISVNDIGSRDILFCMNPILTSAGTDDMTLKLKSNGVIIYQTVYDDQHAIHLVSPIHFILPANTSCEITFTNGDSTSHNVGVSAYGYYLEHIV